MKIIQLKTGTEAPLCTADTVACAVGNFDGVHLGHRELIRLAAAKPGGVTKSAVWTFEVPSSCHLADAKLLTPLRERTALFRALGIDLVFIEDFDAVRDMDAEDFASSVLYENCHVRQAVCGFNFRYGKHASGTTETLEKSLRARGAAVHILPPFCLDGAPVSSSGIRQALADGKPEKAAAMLGRPYAITAEVVHGKELGRTLGFPTINQPFPPEMVVPHFGVYAVRVNIDDVSYIGVANIGVRPTVENTQAVNCETHLLHFDGDLYGKTVKTEFFRFLRPEQRFESVEELRRAVCGNIAEAEAFFRGETEGA